MAHWYLTQTEPLPSGAASWYAIASRLYVHAPTGYTSTALHLALLVAVVVMAKVAATGVAAVTAPVPALARTNLAGTCTVIRLERTFLPSGQGCYSSSR